jgi:hypothetical protein
MKPIKLDVWNRWQGKTKLGKSIGYPVSIRLYNVILNAGIDTLERAATRSKEEWLRKPNAGKATVKELEKLFRDHGISWAATASRVVRVPSVLQLIQTPKRPRCEYCSGKKLSAYKIDEHYLCRWCAGDAVLHALYQREERRR